VYSLVVSLLSPFHLEIGHTDLDVVVLWIYDHSHKVIPEVKGKKMAGRRRLRGTLHKTRQVSIVHMPCKLLKVFDVTGCRGEEDTLLLLPGQVL